MSDVTLGELANRIERCEDDIKSLCGRANKADIDHAATMVKLDHVLTTLGELKQAISDLKSRPATLWDKVIFAFIGAGASAIVALIVNTIGG